MPGRRRDAEAWIAAGGFWLTAAFLLTALLIGGSGSDYWALELTIKLFAIIVIGFFAVGWPQFRPAPGSWLPLAILALAAAVPLLQLIPLPPSLWMSLPGRQTATAIARLAGTADQAKPISLIPSATWHSLSALLPGAAMLIATLHLPLEKRLLLARIVIAAGIMSALLGAVQVASGGTSAILYPSIHNGYPTGLFINRNHQADFLLICIALMPALYRISSAKRRYSTGVKCLFWATVALFCVTVIATSSRTATTMLPIVLIAGFAFMRPRVRTSPRVALLLALLAGVTLLALLNTDSVQRTVSRFYLDDDERFNFWPDIIWAVEQYYPVGSGLGTITPIFNAAERLNIVTTSYVNHAHNEYFELMLETGLMWIPAFMLFLIFIGRFIFRFMKTGERDNRILSYSALMGILVILIHSMFDYPIRMLANETLFAFLCGLLIFPHPVPDSARPVRKRRAPWPEAIQ